MIDVLNGVKAKGMITTFSGLDFDVIDPKPDAVLLEDIAHALSNECRFGGHVRHFHSVAHHSVLVAWQFKDKCRRLMGLLHDASEAYLKDIPRPIKYLFPQYKEMEAKVQDAIIYKLAPDCIFTPQAVLDDIHDTDMAVCRAEAAKLMSCILLKPETWGETPAIPLYFEPLAPEKAEILFLETYYSTLDLID